MVVFGKIQIEQNKMSQVDRLGEENVEKSFFVLLRRKKSAKGIYIYNVFVTLYCMSETSCFGDNNKKNKTTNSKNHNQFKDDSFFYI
jgi:hypothetical protein